MPRQVPRPPNSAERRLVDRVPRRGPENPRVIAGAPRRPAPAAPRRARAAARMRYADPSANRDLLGNRTLLFIFICAFALVTLLQQILYGRNYIKR